MLRLHLVVLVLLIGAAAPAAQAGPILSGSVVDARLCVDPACDTVTMELETERPAPGAVTGTLDIDPVALRIDFDLMLESAVLRGEDGIWTGLELREVRFRGGGTLGLLPTGAPLSSWAISDGTAPVDGSVAGISRLAFSPVIPFSATPTLGGSCRQFIGIDCTITFGPGEFAIPFEGGRYLEVSLTARVPEPAPAVLVVIGVAVAAPLRAKRA